MSESVIKLSDIILSTKQSQNEIINVPEIHKELSISEETIRIHDDSHPNITIPLKNCNANIIQHTISNCEEFADSNKINIENRISEEQRNKPTFHTIENCFKDRPFKNENDFEDIVFKHSNHEDKYEYVSQIADNKAEEKKMTNLCCTKYILCEDLNKDIYMIFVDPSTSKGQQLVDMDINEIKFDDFASIAYIINIKDPEKMKIAIDFLLNYHTKSLTKKAIIIIGGDDNSVMPIIENLRLNSIDLSRCLFATLPLGFSNNLSFTLLYKNSSLANSDINCLKKLLQSYCKAIEIEIDIWKLELKLEVRLFFILE